MSRRSEFKPTANAKPQPASAPNAGADAPEPAFVPFADDAAVRTLGDFSIENGTGRIALHGSLDLTRDRAGLARAQSLKAAVDAIVAALQEADRAADLPDAVAEAAPSAPTVENPFA